MKKYILIILSVLISFIEVKSQTYNKYWVELRDKNNSPYSISNPSAFLSQRAIDRRSKQNIAIDQSDIPVNNSYVAQIKNKGAKVLYSSRWLNAVLVSVDSTPILDSINTLSFVKIASPVAKLLKSNSFSEEINNLPIGVSSKISESDYGASRNQIEMLNGICMHNQGFDGKNMVIAILDAGFYKANTLDVFDSLWINKQIIGTRDFVTGDTLVFEDHDHGSSVLSCIGGNIPGQLIGTAPKAHFWLLRTEDVGSEKIIEEANWIKGAEFADSVGADIINSSLGYTTFDDVTQNHTYADLNGKKAIASIAATIAARKGIIVCNSAGNEGASNWRYIGVPADADSILTVGAVDATGIITGFSSVGPTADGRIKPTVVAKGGASTLVNPYGNTIGTGSGTSFSSPILAGMVACLWQANPTKTNMEIIEAIKKSGSMYNNPDNTYGYGIPNFCAADYALNINKIKADEIIMLSPNPFTNEVSFFYLPTNSKNLTYHIYDLQGKLLIEENLTLQLYTRNTITIKELEVLPKGLYLFVIKSDNFALTKKIIKE